MLPLSLYELLPYIYLGVGAVGCALFDSELITIASVLIILAGFIVLWMRIDYRRNGIEPVVIDVRFDKRARDDRRQKVTTFFPLVDDSGAVVKANRRVGERRALAA